MPAREQRGDRRVEAAREVDADGHVGAQPDAGGVVEQLAQLLGQHVARLAPGPLARTEGDVPPAHERPQAALGNAHVVARRAARRCPGRPSGRAGPPTGGSVSTSANGSRRRSLRGCRSNAAASLANATSPPNWARNSGRMPKPSRARNSSRASRSQMAKANSPFNLLQAGLAPLLVGVDEDLGVGARAEAVAERLELRGQLGVVEDLAVLHRPQPAVLVGDRLVAAREVDDREAGVDHPEAAVAVQPHAVRAAVGQLARHREQQLARGAPIGGSEQACDAAHGVVASWDGPPGAAGTRSGRTRGPESTGASCAVAVRMSSLTPSDRARPATSRAARAAARGSTCSQLVRLG